MNKSTTTQETDNLIELLSEAMYSSGFYSVLGCFDVDLDMFIYLSKCVSNGHKNSFEEYRKICSLMSDVCEFKRSPLFGSDCYFNEDDLNLASDYLSGDLVTSPSETDCDVISEYIRYGNNYIARLKSYDARRARANSHLQSKAVRKRIFKLRGSFCSRCNSESNLSIDHIVSVYNGGGNEDENLQVLCRKCNSSKGAK